MPKIETFRDLIVWQRGMDLAVAVHERADTFPAVHRFGLGSQLRRASTSVPSNVAEGFSRHSGRGYRAHVAIALGSVAEVQTLLELSRRLGLIVDALFDRLWQLAMDVGRLLYGLWRSLAAAAVCYAVALAVIVLGLGPWAVGLLHGFPF